MTSIDKIFIVGLPRTGTTSVCAKFLELGYAVAHTAYTPETFQQAQVIADTPIFNDFELLDTYYPNSKFIYLQRDLARWLPSIKQLLNRMYENLVRGDGGFNPIIKNCYKHIFSPFTLENINNDEFLQNCYLLHHQRVLQHFSNQDSKLLSINISEAESIKKLTDFVNYQDEVENFEKLNLAGKITAWKDIDSSLKVASTRNGRSGTLPYKS